MLDLLIERIAHGVFFPYCPKYYFAQAIQHQKPSIYVTLKESMTPPYHLFSEFHVLWTLFNYSCRKKNHFNKWTG